MGLTVSALLQLSLYIIATCKDFNNFWRRAGTFITKGREFIANSFPTKFVSFGYEMNQTFLAETISVPILIRKSICGQKKIFGENA